MILFGTDGWRAVIADGFTFANVRSLGRAVARMWRNGAGQASALVGYDRRFLSEAFADELARAMASEGLLVYLCTGPVTTPLAAFAGVRRGTRGSAIITASHNPPAYSGVKLRAATGAPIDDTTARALEQLVRSGGPAAAGAPPARIERIDPCPEYAAQLLSLAKPRAGLKVVVDAMYGAASGLMAGIFRRAGCRVWEIHQRRDPLFGGFPPEPKACRLTALSAAVRRHGADVGLASDGDGDRLAAVDATGEYVDPHRLFALLLGYLACERRLTGAVVKTFSTSWLVDREAARLGLPVVETAIGFKYVAGAMVAGGTLLGGEESGGLGFSFHLPERDAILAGLFLAELLSVRGRPLAQEVELLQVRSGPLHFTRADLPCTERQRLSLARHPSRWRDPVRAAMGPGEIIAGDGTKFVSSDGWLLVRWSGTEPVLRLYAETPSPQQTARKLRSAADIVRRVMEDEERRAPHRARPGSRRT